MGFNPFNKLKTNIKIEIMKKALIIGIIASTFIVGYSLYNGGKCTGSNNCNACKNCKYCKHCAKDGGACGVCK